jgi:hypothetical protein
MFGHILSSNGSISAERMTTFDEHFPNKTLKSIVPNIGKVSSAQST